MPACERICERVKLIISEAMSVSRMRLSEAVRFSTATLRLLIVCSKRFCTAPRSDRVVDTLVIASSIALIALSAPEAFASLETMSPAVAGVVEPPAAVPAREEVTPPETADVVDVKTMAPVDQVAVAPAPAAVSAVLMSACSNHSLYLIKLKTLLLS